MSHKTSVLRKHQQKESAHGRDGFPELSTGTGMGESREEATGKKVRQCSYQGGTQQGHPQTDLALSKWKGQESELMMINGTWRRPFHDVTVNRGAEVDRTRHNLVIAVLKVKLRNTGTKRQADRRPLGAGGAGGAAVSGVLDLL